MINSNRKKKNVLVIRGSRTLGDPLLLFGKRMMILLNNFDGDGEETRTYVKYRGWVRGDWSPPLPSPLPSLPIIKLCENSESFHNICSRELNKHFTVFKMTKSERKDNILWRKVFFSLSAYLEHLNVNSPQRGTG